jgi:hypothetical protein
VISRGLLAIALALVCACTRSPSETEARSTRPGVSAPSTPDVRVFGALRAIMHEGRTGAQVGIAQATSTPHAYGVGALSGLRGEITIIDGLPWLAFPDGGGGIRVQSGEADGETAALLAVANVNAWREIVIGKDIVPNELDERIEERLAANGLDIEKPIPIMVEGHCFDVSWHVLAGGAPGASHEAHMRAAVTGVLREGGGTLVGFFSKHHEGVMTHMGQRTHLHVMTSDHAVMGHVDRAGIRAGSRLLLPRVGHVAHAARRPDARGRSEQDLRRGARSRIRLGGRLQPRVQARGGRGARGVAGPQEDGGVSRSSGVRTPVTSARLSPGRPCR